MRLKKIKFQCRTTKKTFYISPPLSHSHSAICQPGKKWVNSLIESKEQDTSIHSYLVTYISKSQIDLSMNESIKKEEQLII
jgi:hypothetical protein